MLKKALAVGIASLTMAGVGFGFSTLPAAAAPWHPPMMSHSHPMMGHHHHHRHQVCRVIWRHHHRVRVCNWL